MLPRVDGRGGGCGHGVSGGWSRDVAVPVGKELCPAKLSWESRPGSWTGGWEPALSIQGTLEAGGASWVSEGLGRWGSQSRGCSVWWR